MHKKDEIEKNIIQAIQYLGKIIGVFSNRNSWYFNKRRKTI